VRQHTRIDINVYRITYIYDIYLSLSLLTYDSVGNNYNNLCTSALMQKVIDKLRIRSPAFVPMSMSYFLKNFVFFINRMEK